jgi:UDP-N-acetylglucosamine--dolichyl-phosphate N-acetylglucosaminephosphotransferase
MTIYSLISIILAFLMTLYMIPKWIIKAKKAGLVGKDVHKLNEIKIAEVGGMTVVVGFLFGSLMYIAFNVFIYNSAENLYILLAALLSISIATLIGFLDDILGWKIGLRQYQKMIFTLSIAIPMMVINAGNSIMNIPFFGNVNFGYFYPLLLIPLGIIFTSNSFNMLAGYNGLEAGQGIFILLTLSFLSYFSGFYWIAILGVIMTASLFAFFIYNKYPSKIFPGDTLTYSVGSLIGIMIILADLEKFGLMLMSLYIIQFFLKLRGKMQKESFAKINKDGTLKNQYNKIYGIEHFVIVSLLKLKIRPTEKKVVDIIWFMQWFICLITIFYYFLV